MSKEKRKLVGLFHLRKYYKVSDWFVREVDECVNYGGFLDFEGVYSIPARLNSYDLSHSHRGAGDWYRTWNGLVNRLKREGGKEVKA